MGTPAQPLLINHDGHVQIGKRVGRRLRILGHEAAKESAEVLAQEALSLHRNGVEDQGGLAGAGHAGEDRDLSLGNFQGNILQVVFPSAFDFDVFLRHASLRQAPDS